MSSEADVLLNKSRANIMNPKTPQLLKLNLSCKSKYLCLSSKAAILIILWAAVVGMMFNTIKDIVAILIIGGRYAHTMDIAILDLIPYATLTITMVFYPLSGFIADVYCGRFKMALISLTLVLASLLLLGIASLLGFYMVESDMNFTPQNGETIPIIILVSLAGAIFLLGLCGFQANYIQLGLDQLLEAPSEHLGLFIHYATWAFTVSSVLDIPLMNIGDCVTLRKKTEQSILILLPSTMILVLLVLYIITCCKYRMWFFVEPGHHNPYKTVGKVLNFAVKHKYPLRRSAFTYADDYIPTRIDFAKERYGGPFTTEQVESVKTLIRMLIILLAMGPVFVLQLSASQYVFPIFSIHVCTRRSIKSLIHDCTALKVLTRIVETGGLVAFFTIIIFPFYIWIIFSILRRKIPKIFTRFGIGVILSLLGVASMLIIDMVGHSLIGNETVQHNSTVTQCMFQIIKHNYTLEHNALNMHWSVFVVPSLFLGIGPLLITTTLEFISAQSPQSMKGLLVGVFFVIQGLFQLIGIIAILPVSLTQPWPLDLPSIISCCSAYLGFIILMGLLGLALFIFTAKKYKYRERDDIIFHQRDVEEVYARYLIQAPEIIDNLDEDESDYTT